MSQRSIVSQQEWLKARIALLAKEKAFTRSRAQLNAERLALPCFRLDKDYLFDGPAGKTNLAELFNGRSQLMIQHFMMGPGVAHQCVGCSLVVDHAEGILEHLENHDVTYVVVARAPIDEIESVRKRMGWRTPWVSSFNSDFNYDFGVSFTPEQLATGHASYNFQKLEPWAVGLEDLGGHSVFYKDETGQIFQTYSTFARGAEQFLGIYGILDVMPKGRNEVGPHYTLGDWARPRNMYGKGGMLEPNGRYHAAACACASHG